MPATAVTLTGSASEEILAADENRDNYVLQLQTAEPAYLAFGEDAVTATGLALLWPGDTVTVRGPKANLACNGHAANTPTIGIETMESIEYRSGQFEGPWPLT